MLNLILSNFEYIVESQADAAEAVQNWVSNLLRGPKYSLRKPSISSLEGQILGAQMRTFAIRLRHLCLVCLKMREYPVYLLIFTSGKFVMSYLALTIRNIFSTVWLYRILISCSSYLVFFSHFLVLICIIKFFIYLKLLFSILTRNTWIESIQNETFWKTSLFHYSIFSSNMF